MRTLAFVVVISSIMLGVTTDILAFDGQREGFVIGFGLGMGYISYEGEVEYSNGDKTIFDRQNRFTVATDVLKLGYAPTNQLQINTTILKGSWFTDPNSNQDGTLLCALIALGCSYYLRPDAPSPFFSGGIGSAGLIHFLDDEPDAQGGFGWYLGAGYEILPHWSIELDIIQGSPHEERPRHGTTADFDFWTVLLKLNILAY